MNTLMIITLTVGVSVYALCWHNQDAHSQKEKSQNPERELRGKFARRCGPKPASRLFSRLLQIFFRRKPTYQPNVGIITIRCWFALAGCLAGMSLVAAEPPFESPSSNSTSGLVLVKEEPKSEAWLNGIGNGLVLLKCPQRQKL